LVPFAAIPYLLWFLACEKSKKFLEAYRAVIFQQILSLYGEKFAKFLISQNWKKNKLVKKTRFFSQPFP